MRARTIAAIAVAAALGGGVAPFAPALSASAKSPPNLQNLSNEINKAKKLTYYIQYKAVSNGQTSTVIIAQQPPKSLFSTGDGNSIISTGKITYECYPNSGNSGSTGNTGSGNTGNSGNTGTSTTTTTKPPAELCGASKGANPLLGAETAFSPAAATGVFAQAEDSAVAKALGIKISYSTGKFGGLSATCVSVTRKGQTAKYCVASPGILAYSSGGKNNYFELVQYTNHPPASAFQLPPGATVGKAIP